MRRFWTLSLVALLSFVLIAALTGVSIAGQGGKGKGGGGGGGGGEDPPPATPPVTYDVRWLPSFDGVTPSIASDVDKFGTVVGFSIGGDISDWHALVFPASGGIIELQTELADLLDPGWLITSAREINNSGRIAGHGLDPLGNRKVFVYDELPTPTLQWLEIQGTTTTQRLVRELTEGGLVLAELTVDELEVNLVWDPDNGTITDLHQVTNALDFAGSVTSLNDDGIVVGGIGFGDDAFYYELGANSPQSLPDLGKGGYATDINSSGVIVGEVESSHTHPSRWINGVLDVLSDKSGGAEFVNETGQILGTLRSKTKGRNSIIRPFLFDPVDGFWEIDDLVDPLNDPDALDWFLVEDISVSGIAEGIEEQPYGPIIVWASFETGTEHGVLIPVLP